MREGTTGLRAFMRRITLAALIVLAAVSARAAELDFPALTGHVVDEAGILDQATRSTLATRLADLEARTTDQVVVVTLRSLRGVTIEEYGVALGRHWHLGQAGKNNGVLLIVAPHERKVRIEVGYGLEGKLTDAATKLIIENTITPRFRANDFPGGIRGGADHIIELLTYRPGEMLPSRDLGWYGKSAADDWRDWIGEKLKLVLFGVLFLVFAIMFGAMGLLILYLPISLVVKSLIWMGLLPKRSTQGQPKRAAWIDFFDTLQRGSYAYSSRSRRWYATANSGSGSSSWSSDSGSSSSSSSSSDSSYSGGGGDFGGGGSSGSW